MEHDCAADCVSVLLLDGNLNTKLLVSAAESHPRVCRNRPCLRPVSVISVPWLQGLRDNLDMVAFATNILSAGLDMGRPTDDAIGDLNSSKQVSVHPPQPHTTLGAVEE